MDMWNTETAIKNITGLNISIPAWIEQDISPYTIAAVVQGGCESGAYMPAVTYHMALKTMSEHGDDVLQYIEDQGIEFEFGTLDETSWSGLASKCLSVAVYLWACSVESELESFEPSQTLATCPHCGDHDRLAMPNGRCSNCFETV